MTKTDAADAICEALMRPTMRFVPIKSAEQQSVLMLHRARELLVRQRTMLINALRGHCAEFGIVIAQGASKVTALIAMIEDLEDARLPALAREALGSLVGQLLWSRRRKETRSSWLENLLARRPIKPIWTTNMRDFSPYVAQTRPHRPTPCTMPSRSAGKTGRESTASGTCRCNSLKGDR